MANQKTQAGARAGKAGPIDEYLASLDNAAARTTLTRLREQLRELLPSATETISYRMPAFRLPNGKVAAGFAFFGKNCGYYPHSGGVVPKLGALLEGYQVSKSGVAFAPDEPLPKKLVTALVRTRLAEIEELSRAPKTPRKAASAAKTAPAARAPRAAKTPGTAKAATTKTAGTPKPSRTAKTAAPPKSKPAAKAAPAPKTPKPKGTARVFAIPFATVYPLYVEKAENKGRTRGEVDQVIGWLTGYRGKSLERAIADKRDLRTFFDRAPRWNPNASLITGVVCGVRVEDLTDPLMQKIRYLDKLIDELARGKKMASILRT